MRPADTTHMARHPWSGDTRATSHQRLAIRCLLRALELPTDAITLMHRLPFERADIPLPRQGMPLNAALCELTRAQANRLIDVLRAEQEALT